MSGVSNVTTEEFINEGNDDLKKYILMFFV